MRVEPPAVPYRYMYIDHLGPINVKIDGRKTKVYLLCFSCMWSRYINLQMSLDLSTENFLRAFQMHVHKFGMPSKVVSDSGTSLIAGGNIIKDYLKDPDTREYLEEHGVEEVNFSQYYKGNSALGSLVESSVKITKKLILAQLKTRLFHITILNF